MSAPQLDRIFVGDGEYVKADSAVRTVMELQAENARLREQLGHAVPAIEQLTKEREEYRTRWLASEVELRLALEAFAHEQAGDKHGS